MHALARPTVSESSRAAFCQEKDKRALQQKHFLHFMPKVSIKHAAELSCSSAPGLICGLAVVAERVRGCSKPCRHTHPHTLTRACTHARLTHARLTQHCLQASTNTIARIRTRTHPPTQAHTHTHTHRHTHSRICTHTGNTHTHTHTRTHTQADSHMHTQALWQTHTCTQRHADTHVHASTPTCAHALLVWTAAHSASPPKWCQCAPFVHWASQRTNGPIRTNGLVGAPLAGGDAACQAGLACQLTHQLTPDS